MQGKRIAPGVPLRLQEGDEITFGSYTTPFAVHGCEVPLSNDHGQEVGRGRKRGRMEATARELCCSSEEQLRKHGKVVSCLAFSKSGARLITGSFDYSLFIYDFAGLDFERSPFREIVPDQGHFVSSVSWSPTASHGASASDGREHFDDVSWCEQGG